MHKKRNQPSSETLTKAESFKACATALTVSSVTSADLTSSSLRCFRIRLKEQIRAKLTTVWLQEESRQTTLQKAKK